MPEASDQFIHNGEVYTFRSADEIRTLIEERDAHYAAGETDEGDAVRQELKYTAVRPVRKRE